MHRNYFRITTALCHLTAVLYQNEQSQDFFTDGELEDSSFRFTGVYRK